MRSISKRTVPGSRPTAPGTAAQRNERRFKRGSLMFIEGEASTEMYIIRSGLVRILKQEGDSTIELATLGPGSVLGELSLLDHQPRSATAQVVEDVAANVIDEELFENTMRSVPPWLGNIVTLVVKRLRDTMKRCSDDVVRRSVGGVLKILLLLYEVESAEAEEEKCISLNKAKDAVSATIGIGDVETENVLLHLIIKELILIRKNDVGREFIIVRNPEACKLYVAYLRAHQHGGALTGENLTEAAIALIDTVLAAGTKTGRRIKGTIVRVGQQQLALEQERRGGPAEIDRTALEALVEAKLLVPHQLVEQPDPQTGTQPAYLYNEEAIKRIQRLHQWLPTFEESIEF